MIMIGSTKDTGFGRLMKSPREVGGVTRSIYLVIADADVHHARAKAAGAGIVMAPVTQDMAVATIPAATSKALSGLSAPYDPWASQA